MPSPFSGVRKLGDAPLLRRLEGLAGQDRALEVEILIHIAEFDRRKLYRVEGYPSLFRYLVEQLRMSSHAAYNRMHVARATREFPQMLDHLRDGRLTLTGARLLVPHLTHESCDALLERAKHKTCRQIEELVADLAPQPDVPESIRRIPERTVSQPPSPALPPSPVRVEVPQTKAGAPRKGATGSQPAPARRPEPLGQGRFKVQFTGDRELIELIGEVQSLMRHQVPDGNLAAVFGRALRLLRDDLRRRKFGATDRPRRAVAKGARRSRHVPNAVRRQVAARDEESCSYVSPNGKRCGSKDFVEYEHQDPWARYGVHRPERMRLLCREHNALAAEAAFGRSHMDRFKPSPGASSEARGNAPCENSS